MHKTVQIQIEPNEVMVDEKFNVQVSGLKPYGKITINARAREKEKVFTSLGCYRANSLGIVDCSEHPSQAGTYTGIYRMGLVWSLIQAPGQKPGQRLLKADVCSPQVINFTVYKEHLSLDDVFSTNKKHAPVATSEVIRWYKSKDVMRVPIREGKLRGALFIPPGKGPFPGILDLFGGAGGLIETRAALLASHGYVVFALAYIKYEDVPGRLIYLSLDYFKDAVKFLKSHPKIQGRDIGAIGVSKGGEIIQLLTTRCPELKAIISISGPPFTVVTTFTEDGNHIESKTEVDSSKSIETEEGMVGKATFPLDPTYLTPVWESEANMLSICGTDDQCIPVELQWLQRDAWPSDEKHKYESVTYEGAGHLIEPPYAPLTRVSFWMGVHIVWGGNALDHSFAQEDAWKRTLEFFNRHLKDKYDSNIIEKSKL